MTDEDIDALADLHLFIANDTAHTGAPSATVEGHREFAREIERRTLERAAERCMYITGSAPGEYFAQEIRALMEQKNA